MVVLRLESQCSAPLPSWQPHTSSLRVLVATVTSGRLAIVAPAHQDKMLRFALLYLMEIYRYAET